MFHGNASSRLTNVGSVTGMFHRTASTRLTNVRSVTGMFHRTASTGYAATSRTTMPVTVWHVASICAEISTTETFPLGWRTPAATETTSASRPREADSNTRAVRIDWSVHRYSFQSEPLVSSTQLAQTNNYFLIEILNVRFEMSHSFMETLMHFNESVHFLKSCQ